LGNADITNIEKVQFRAFVTGDLIRNVNDSRQFTELATGLETFRTDYSRPFSPFPFSKVAKVELRKKREARAGELKSWK
jgi:hypothetical protein